MNPVDELLAELDAPFDCDHYTCDDYGFDNYLLRERAATLIRSLAAERDADNDEGLWRFWNAKARELAVDNDVWFTSKDLRKPHWEKREARTEKLIGGK